MTQNKQASSRSRGQAATPGRAFDITGSAPKKAAAKQGSFPAVGMTLSSYASTANQPRGRQPKEPGWFRRTFSRRRVVTVLVLLVLVVGGWVGFKFLYNLHRLFGNSVFSALSTSKLDGESSGRVNVLLAGNSADDPGHGGANLTDSIMILSIDTKHNTAFMLSVPRDLYVHIPGDGHQKINAVYPNGTNFSENGYPAGGMGLLTKTIQQDMGITCQYYALIDYNAMRDAVNSVGGVDITINSTDKRGLYDPSKDWSTGGSLVRLTNGTHHLNGEQALDLARARGDAYGSYGFANSDFDRTTHQRQLILALRTKATSAGVLANPVKLGNLFDAVGGNVKTNLKLSDVRRLYQITKDINGNSIQSVGLNDANGKNLLSNYRTPTGESALVPAAGVDDYSDIQTFIKQLTSPSLVVREGASVVLLNGTSTFGLASRESDNLATKNITVDDVSDADAETYTTTQIIDLSKGAKPATLAALKKAYPGSTVTTTNPYGTKYKTDFIVVLGSDRLAAANTKK